MSIMENNEEHNGSGAANEDASIVKTYRSIQDLIYQRLQSDIAAGVYKFGEKLMVRELSRKFQVSGAPVRESLMCLVTDGLVTFKPRIGFFVSNFEPKEIREIFEVRYALEALACEKLVKNVQEEHLLEVEEILEALRRCPNADEWHLLNREFHLTLYKGCDSERLQQEITRYWDLLNIYLRVYMRWFVFPQKAQEEHEQMYLALKNADLENLKELLFVHLFRTCDDILGKIAASKK